MSCGVAFAQPCVKGSALWLFSEEREGVFLPSFLLSLLLLSSVHKRIGAHFMSVILIYKLEIIFSKLKNNLYLIVQRTKLGSYL